MLENQTAVPAYPCPYCFVKLAQQRGLSNEEPTECDDYVEVKEFCGDEDLCDEDFLSGVETPVNTDDEV